MPTFPTGVILNQLEIGPVSDFYGDAATLTVSVTPVLQGGVRHIVHTASGQALVASTKQFFSDAVTGLATISLPTTDQTGWQDPSGQAIDVSTKPGWYYALAVTATVGNTTVGQWTKNIQPLQAQTAPIDVDLVGSGQILEGVLAPSAVVTSFAGLTGEVTVAEAEAALTGKASITQAVPVGGAAGQVLAKATLTDYDVTWVDAANAAHSHAAADVTSGTFAPARLPTVTATAQGAMVAADKSKLDASTAGAFASRIVMRDAAGQAHFTAPTHAEHVTTKKYADDRFAVRATKLNTPFTTRWIAATATVAAHWEYGTLADAQAAGLDPAQTVWFIGNPGGTLPGWQRAGDIWTQE